MLIVQQNCGKGYKYTISTFETGLGFNISVICIQELFLANRSLAHAGFNLYWPFRTYNQKDMQVLIVVKKGILNRIVIENRTDLVSHPYYMVFDIKV